MKEIVIKKERFQTNLVIAIDNKFIVSLDEIDYFDLEEKENFNSSSDYQKYLLKLNTSDIIEEAYMFSKENNYLPKYSPEIHRFWGNSKLKEPDTIEEVREFYQSIYTDYLVEIVELETKTIVEKKIRPYIKEEWFIEEKIRK